jgi:hypothetical protein
MIILTSIRVSRGNQKPKIKEEKCQIDEAATLDLYISVGKGRATNFHFNFSSFFILFFYFVTFPYPHSFGITLTTSLLFLSCSRGTQLKLS